MREIKALVLVAGAMAAARVAGAALVVAQAEAPVNGVFAPVDFNGRSSVTEESGNFAGITFFADSGHSLTGTDMSGHAMEVGGDFYGASSPAHPYVTGVRVLSSDGLLNAILLPQPSRPGGKVPAPLKLPGGAKVLNASFVGSTGYSSVDASILSRMDLVATRDGVLAVAGAVTATTGSFQGSTLIWGARNVLAVRGDNPATPFDPSGNAVGRRYADVWGNGLASDITGQVSGMAAAIIGQALAEKRADLARPATVRALLMAGADRSVALNGINWTADLANGLSMELGAGKADLAGAESLMAAPIATFAAAGKPTLKLRAVPAARTEGVGALASIKPKATVISTFTLANDQASVSAALAWNTAQKDDLAGDLQISLIPITMGAKNVATLTATPLLALDSPGDNIRLVTSSMGFPAGTYAWVIKNQGKETVAPSLAYEFGDARTVTTTSVMLGDMAYAPPVPEPPVLGWLVAAGVSLRRRRSSSQH